MDTLTSLRVFCTVAELKSFTAAADRLGLSPAMASKHVMHLESRLGTRLLNRTSRHVSMTESGMLYLNQTRQMLDGLDEVEAAVSNVTVTPRGTLRLSAPVWAANTLGYAFAITATVFAVFGVIYNVRPIRAKDRAFLDVIVESLNNPLRFLFGWFAVVPSIAPPVSILLAYWCGGAFLMAAKRVSEHRAIVEAGGTANLAAYRPSFAVYTHSSLVTSCLVYAQGFAFMMAIFLLKYRIEYLVVVPMLIALFASYMRLALTPDSAAARPEELMRQPAMLIAAAVTMALFGVLTFVDLPWLNSLTSSDLIRLGGIR